MIRLLALFIIIPFVELLIIFKIGTSIGFWPALAIIVIPGLLGAAMARSQGAAVLSQVKGEIARGRLPGAKILDGFLIFCGGLLLITPGILTGLVGLTVLFPGVRRLYRDFILHRLWRLVVSGGLKFYLKKPFP